MDFKIKQSGTSIMRIIILLIVLLAPCCSVAQEFTLKNVERKAADNTWGEQICYNWKDSQSLQLRVVFRHRRLDDSWIVKIKSSNRRQNSEYTSSQLSTILDESWNHFDAAKPDASLVNIGFDVSICSNIWTELQNRLKKKLPLLNCCATFKSKRLVEIFSTIFSSSKGIEDFARVISNHGKTITYSGSWDMVMIEESFWGKPWIELVDAPNVGLKKPIRVVLSLQAK